MRLVYVANMRLPTEKAHGIQILNMCAAFAEAGVEVELMVPSRPSAISQDPFSYYGLERKFTITKVPVAPIPLWVPGAYQLQTILFGLGVNRRLGGQPLPDILYTRGEMVLFLWRTWSAHTKLVWETHIKPAYPARYRRAARGASAVVAVTRYYAEEISRLWGVEKERVLWAPDGVALEAFAHMPAKEKAREQLGLPLERRIVVYAGSDLPWKGLNTLRDAAVLLPEKFLTVFVGPIAGESSSQRHFAGVRPPTEVPLWLAAADVLVLTGSKDSSTAQHYTSPLKLFEYMAAERPIVATDLPAVRDVLSEESAFLTEPDAAHMAAAIERAASPAGEARAKVARQSAEGYSWHTRAARILSHSTRAFS